MYKEEIKQFLERFLGPGISSAKGEILFECPQKVHRHSKLSVNINTGNYQCWACNNLKGRNLFTLIKRLNATKENFEQLQDILKRKTGSVSIKKYDKTSSIILQLPKEFVLLNPNTKNPEHKKAYNYITKHRGFSDKQIQKYNIGYCVSGEYAQRIIVPSYAANGSINYFISRSYYNNVKRYKNPKIEKQAIIPFELYISWSIPIILVEGIFDAIAVDHNCIPLLGNSISDLLLFKLLQNDTPLVYLALDGGEGTRFVYKNVKRLLDFNIQTKIIELPPGEDAASLGTKRFWDIFKTNSVDITLKTLLTYKKIGL